MGFGDFCSITAVQGCCSETRDSFTRVLPLVAVTWRWMRGMAPDAEKKPWVCWLDPWQKW